MKKTLNYTALFIVLLASIQVVNAQPVTPEDLNSALGFDTQVNDVQAPIHFLVGLGMLVGAYIGYRKLK